MRPARLVAMLAVCLLLATTGCGSRTVSGTARPDPRTPGTAISSDGFGVIVGKADATVQIELYTEPQCSHCAHLQGRFGPQLRTLINLGDLAVTYRPVTFLDQARSDYSVRVSNALFLAVRGGTSGPAFQSFAQNVWGHQQPFSAGPSNAELSAMAAESHVSTEAVDLIRAGRPALNTADMAHHNEARLQQILRGDPATPAVYDLNRRRLVDITRDDWVSRLMTAKLTT